MADLDNTTADPAAGQRDRYRALISERIASRDDAPLVDDGQRAVYRGLIAKNKEDEGARLRLALDGAFGKTPDQAARVQELVKSTGLPADLIERNFDQVHRGDQVRRLQASMTFSPVLRRQFTDPKFAALAHDDAATLAGVEKVLGGLKDTAKYIVSYPGLDHTLMGDLGAGFYALNRGIAGDVQSGFDVLGAAIDPLVGRLLPHNPAADVSGFLGGVAGNAKAMSEYLSPSKGRSSTASGVTSGVQSIAQNVGMLPLLAINPIAYLLGMAGSVGGQSYLDAREQNVNIGQSLTFGVSQAAIEFATERLPLFRLLKDIKADIGLFRTIGRQAMVEVPQEQLATFLQDANEWAVLPENRGKTLRDFAAERPDAAYQTLIATLVGVAGQTSVMHGAYRVMTTAAERERNARAAEESTALLKALTDYAAASRLAARAPDTFGQFVEQAAQGSGAEHVYISADALMQSGLAEAVATVSPSVADQLAGAAQTGGDIVIPVAEYAARIAPTEAANELLDHLRTDPEQMSRAEARDWVAHRQQEMTEEFERAARQQESDDAFQESANAVRDTVRTQLEQTGRFTKDVTDAYGTLAGTWYAVQSARLGVTPQELYQRYPLQVQAEGVTSEQVLNQTVRQKSLDAEYLEAVQRGDMDTAQRLVDQAARRAGYLSSAEYRMQHQAPNREDDVSLADVRDVDLVPADYWTHPQWYTADPRERRAHSAVTALLRRMDARKANGEDPGSAAITVYRAVPKDVKESKLRNGDWVTPTEEYARDEGAKIPGGYRIISSVVSARDLFWDGNSIAELGYDNGNKYAYKNTKNNRKQFDVVTRDEHGDIVPLSKRFNPRKAEEYYQSTGGLRGTFSPSTLTISLLKNADLSTFLHETGHFFLEAQLDMAARLQQEAELFRDAMKPGELELLADTQAVLQWFGLRDLNEWYGLDFEQQRSYHEQFARGFEAYLFEGKAPSIELQGLFQRFRAWLVSVYRQLKALNVELSDEVRGVFDRMLATSAQIELAEQGRSMMPLFETAEQAGMTPSEFAAYQALAVQATADAIEDLQARGLRDMQWLANARSRMLRQLQRDAAARRAEVRMQARREIMSQPVYRAWQLLTGKLTPDDKVDNRPPVSDPDTVDPGIDSLFVAIAKLGGLDRAEAQNQWGVDPKETGQPVFGKPVLRAKGGRSIEEMRQALAELGYLSRDESNPDWDPREFEDRFDAERRGDTQYSIAYDVDLAQSRNEPAGSQVLHPESVTAARLHLGELAAEGYPAEIIDALKARRMTAREGWHPDIVAELIRHADGSPAFTSGDEMIQALVAAETPREAIAGLTDALMIERYGDLATPEAIERAADAAIHNDARARFTATEAAALERMANPTAPAGTDRRGRPVSRGTLLPAARQYAREIIARTKIRALRPSQYTSAEARAGRAAEAAKRQGDLRGAAAEKRNQVVQQQLARQAQAARDEVERTLRYLRGFEREGTRRNLDPDYREQIDNLLERFDLRSGQSLRAIDKRTSLAQWIEARSDEGTEPDIDPWLVAEANRTHYKNLTVEQLRGLEDAVRQIEHLGRLKQRLLTARDKRALDAIVAELQESITANSRGPVDNERRNTIGSRTRHAMRGLLAAHRKFANLVREMDGFQDGGPLWEAVIRPMNDAGNKEASMRADAARRLNELARPVLALGRMGGKGEYFASIGRSLNRGERLAIALNMGNAGNVQRLLDGRGWTIEQLRPVMQSLSAAEAHFVQGVWDFFESYRPEIAAKERRVSGVEPDWVEPVPFELRTAEGQIIQMRGGYYPIKYDINQSGQASAHADAESAKQMMKAAYTAATTRRSFTKSRVEEVRGRPLSLSFDGIYQGANEVIHDLAWHEWLIDVNRLFKRLDREIRTGYGAETATAIKRAIEDIAVGDKPATNAVESSLNHLRTGATVAGLGWNLYTALLQPIGATQSVARVGGTWFARGIREFYGNPTQMAAKVNEVNELSAFMRNRARTMNREINEVQNQLTGAKGKARTLLDASFFILIQKTQMMVDYPTWLGAYAKAEADPTNTLKNGDLDVQRVVALADQAVIDSQGEGQIKDLAQVQRGHPAFKLFTNFYSYFSTSVNLAVDATKRTDFRDPAQVAALAGDYLLIAILPAVISGLLGFAMKGKDDDDLLEWMIDEQIEYLMGMFVGLRELAPVVKGAIGHQAFDYSGPAGLRFFAEMTKLGRQIGQFELDAPLAKAINNSAGILFHYPAGQVQRTVQGVSALLEGRTKNPMVLFSGYRGR